MKIRAVFFDAVGTLFSVRETVGAIYSSVARPYGGRLSPAALDAEFREGFTRTGRLDYAKHPRETWDRLEKRWWYDLVKDVFTHAGDLPTPFESYFQDVYENFENHENWILYPEVPETLRLLKDEGLILGVISNFDRRILPLCDGLGLSPWFDSIHLPRDVGAAKPDPRIFQAALSRHQLLPREAIHVGDHRVEDVEGARASGMTPILIHRNGKAGEVDGERIGSLLELPGLIGKEFGRN
jgi:putative hydrolase of the HAD superfamily